MIDLSGEADLRPLSEVTGALREAGGVDFLLVGATARDVVLRGYGISPARVTNDVDFAFAVRDWDEFSRTRERLLRSPRFLEDRDPQRVLFSGIPVDLIPFGSIEDQSRHITWPSDAAVMNVLGFEEADRTAQPVLLPDAVQIRVPEIATLLVMKLAAWGDRKRDKDATDIQLLALHYGDISEGRLFGDEMPTYSAMGFDMVLAGARLLGRDARRALQGPKSRESLQALASILEPELDLNGQLRLATRMSSISSDVDRSRRLLEEILKGVREDQAAA